MVLKARAEESHRMLRTMQKRGWGCLYRKLSRYDNRAHSTERVTLESSVKILRGIPSLLKKGT